MDQPLNRARASAATAVAFFFTAAISAAQAFLLVLIAGEGPKTEAFLAVYGVYVPVALVGISLRRSLAPFLGGTESGAEFQARAREILGRLSLMSAAGAALLLLATPFVAGFLTRDLPHDARVTGFAALALLAGAAYLQTRSGAMSAVLNAVRRLPTSVSLYVLGGTAGLALSAGLLALLGPVGSAAGALGGAAVTFAGHVRQVRKLGASASPRWEWLFDPMQRRVLGFVAAGSALAVAQVLGLTIAVAALGDTPQQITPYAYAYFLMSMTVGLSASPVTLVTLPDGIASIAAGGRDAGRRHVAATAPYIAAVLAPLLAAYAGFGERLLELVFGSSLSDRTIDRLYELGLALEPMAIGISLFVLAGTVVIAQGERSRTFALALVLAGLQAVCILGVSGYGVVAIAWAHGAAAVVAGIAAVATVGGSRTPSLLRDLLLGVAPAYALAAVFLVAGELAALRADSWVAVPAFLAASAVYAAMLVRIWPSVGRQFLRLFPRRREASETR